VMDTLDLALQAGEESEPARRKGQMHRHYVEKLFTYLDSQKADANRLASLEWSYLRLLEDTKRGIKVLYQQVISSPELFFNILKMAFRAEGELAPEVSDETNGAITRQARHLLHGIHTIPGAKNTAGGKNIDLGILNGWVLEVRRLAREAGLLGDCDSQIGKILSYSPQSPDGSWPCVEVRDLLEEVKSPSIENGFQVGKYNQRGVIYRGKGGKQEWDLAQRYRTYAEKIRMKWPRTAIILEGLASSYEHEAKEWDKRSEWGEYD